MLQQPAPAFLGSKQGHMTNNIAISYSTGSISHTSDVMGDLSREISLRLVYYIVNYDVMPVRFKLTT